MAGQVVVGMYKRGVSEPRRGRRGAFRHWADDLRESPIAISVNANRHPVATQLASFFRVSSLLTQHARTGLDSKGASREPSGKRYYECSLVGL